MTWFKVDDALAFHRKTVAAGNAAMGLWVRAGAWCAQQLTDGKIPADIARTLGKPSEIKRLVAVGLWIENDADSYQFHDWFQSNPSRVEVEQRREAEAQKKAAWRARREARRAAQKGLSTGDDTGDSTVDSPVESEGVSPGESDGVSRSPRPDPTRPDPDSSKEESPENSLSDAPRPDVKDLCDHLHRRITEGGTKATVTKQWHDAARLLLDRDKRPADEAHRLIDWCQDDDFWRTNILGMPKFRKQYDQLRLKAGVALRGAGVMYDVNKLPEPGTGWSAEQLDMVLGKDSWTVPEPPADMSEDDGYMWQQQQKRRHFAQRVRAALDAIGRTA